MSPAEVTATVRARLAAELAVDLGSLDRLASSVAEVHATPDGAVRSLALAFQLERYYTAAEALLSRVLRTIDGDVPTGGTSHQAVLSAASVPVDGLRAAILSPEALEPLRELLAFRHYARHGYDVEPKAKRVDEIATLLMGAHPIVAACLGRFIASLSRGERGENAP